MHYLTLVAVDIPEVKEEPEVDAAIKSAIEELKGKNFDGEKGAMSTIVRNLRLERLCAISNAFSRAVDCAVSEAMEPYCENTEDPRFLEFVDMTESAEKEYQTGHVEMVRLPEGKYVFPHSRPFSDRYIVSEGKVLERDAGPCKHAIRTKRAKKMQVVNRAFRKVYTSLKDYAEEYCCYTYEADRNRCGYYSITNCPYAWKLMGCSINLQVFFYLNLTIISRRLDKLRIAVYNILIIRFIVSMFFEERRYVLLQREGTV